MKKELRIVFLGTPDFAVASLDALVKAGHHIAGVVTAPDKPAGRGKKLRITAVKQYALDAGLKIMQPANLKDAQFLDELSALNANLGIVVAFRMLPEAVWQMPEMGTFNLHASLLPQYRGAAPINHAIMNGETETGVTTFFLNHAIDTGNIIFRSSVPILPDETFGQLHDKLMVEGAKLVLKTVEAIKNDDIEPVPQKNLLDEDQAIKTAPKLFREDCEINWRQSGKRIHDFVRGLSPIPAAHTFLLKPDGQKEQLKIFKVDVVDLEHSEKPGTIITDQKTIFGVYVFDGKIMIRDLQMAGKKRHNVKDFLNGYQIKPDSKMV